MTTLATRIPAQPSTPFDWFRTIIRGFEERRRRDAAEATLQGLDARTLRDIGVDRSEIASLAYSNGTDTTRIDRTA